MLNISLLLFVGKLKVRFLPNITFITDRLYCYIYLCVVVITLLCVFYLCVVYVEETFIFSNICVSVYIIILLVRMFVCLQSFLRQERLTAHLVVHGNEAEKEFHCKVCLRRFCSNSALTTHYKHHIG